MARSRMIKPEFWDDEKLGMKTSLQARLVFVGLWNHSDDYGVVKGNPMWLKNHILPYEEALSIETFKTWLKELENINCILPFEYDGETFFFIRKFSKHQSINKPSKQRNPTPPKNILELLNTATVTVTGDSGSGTELLPSETETETETEYNADSSESASCSQEKEYRAKSGKKLTGKRLETFEQFWDRFNFKQGKATAADAWLKIPHLTDHIVKQIISAAEMEASRRPALIEGGGSPKWAQGWLSERRWEDELYQGPDSAPVTGPTKSDEQQIQEFFA